MKEGLRASGRRSNHIILEVGCDVMPFALIKKNALSEGDVYIGVDLFSWMDTGIREKLMARTIYKNKQDLGERYILQSDAKCLPFPNKSVDQIVFANVFGDSRTIWQHEQMVVESARVLRPQGLLTVVETYTPSVIPLDRLRQLMSDHGNLHQINEGEESDRSQLNKYVNKYAMDINQQSFSAQFSFSPR